MTMMKKMIKPALVALAISMTLGSTLATAAVRNTTGTLLIHGFQPLLPLVGAKGELKPGATVTVSDEYYAYFDRDNKPGTDSEKDISKDSTRAIIQWYIRNESDAATALPPPADAWGTGLTFTIPFVDKNNNDVDYANERKILSFRIVPLTENGLPDIGKAVEVKNSVILAGSVVPTDVPPSELPVNPDNPYTPGVDPTAPGERTPEVTGPGGNNPPTDPDGPSDGSGVIYPSGDGFLVRIAYAKLDEDGAVIMNATTGLPELDLNRIVYDDLADETKTKLIDPVDAYGNRLLGPDGITELGQIPVSLKTPTIPTVKAKYAVAIYEAKRNPAGNFLRDPTTNEVLVKADENGPINMVGAFKNSIKWTLGASSAPGSPALSTTAVPTSLLSDFDGELIFNTQENNDFAKAISSVASEQGLVIGVTFEDNIAAPINKGAAATTTIETPVEPPVEAPVETPVQ